MRAVLLASLTVIATLVWPTNHGRTSLDGRYESSAVESQIACVPGRDISASLRQFAIGNESEVRQARALLLSNSRRSEKCRKEVVSALMSAMDKPSLDFTHDTTSYNLWLYGADLLGDLKAAEALDLLISHLSLTDRFFSTSMNHQPALRGVIKMGRMAIPKLTKVLLHGPDPRMRHAAVYCIATIGGPDAVRSLKEAFSSESDNCVSKFIRVSLESFDREGNIKNRMDWFSGGLCN